MLLLIAAKVVTVCFLKHNKRAIWGVRGGPKISKSTKTPSFCEYKCPQVKKKVFFIYFIDNRLFDFVKCEDPVNNVHIDWIFRIKKMEKI